MPQHSFTNLSELAQAHVEEFANDLPSVSAHMSIRPSAFTSTAEAQAFREELQQETSCNFYLTPILRQSFDPPSFIEIVIGAWFVNKTLGDPIGYVVGGALKKAYLDKLRDDIAKALPFSRYVENQNILKKGQQTSTTYTIKFEPNYSFNGVHLVGLNDESLSEHHIDELLDILEVLFDFRVQHGDVSAWISFKNNKWDGRVIIHECEGFEGWFHSFEDFQAEFVRRNNAIKNPPAR